MRRWRALWIRLFHTDRNPTDFDAELESHIAMHTEDGMRSGLSQKEARRQALILLGGLDQARQAHRDGRTLLWLENALQDLRYGLRTLRRSPGFTATAVLTLGLGIGACTAVFSLVNAVLIRSLPYGEPEHLVNIYEPNPRFNVPAEVFGPSYGDFFLIRQRAHSFQSMTLYGQATFNVASQGAVERVGAATVDGEFFRTLQSAPILGRAISDDDQQPGRKVALISHSLWQSMFGGRRDVFSCPLILDGNRYQIIGVMPAGFEYPHNYEILYGLATIKATDIWVPLALTPQQMEDLDSAGANAVGRLRAGVTMAQAQAEMSALMAAIDQLHKPNMRGWGALLESFIQNAIGPARPMMRILLAAVLMVLLIASANAASLLLARASGRMRELGVRIALGAGTSRVVRQLLTEALLVCAAGGGVGVALAFLFLRLAPRLDPHNIPRLNEASLDWRVLLFAAAVSLLTGMLTALLPAVTVSRTRLTDSLAAGAGRTATGGHSRAQSILIVLQTALLVILLAGAGLLIRSYINVQRVDTGFARTTVTMNLQLDARYRQAKQRIQFFKTLIDRISDIPGVTAAGAVNDLPLSKSESLDTFWVEGFPNVKDQLAEARSATSGYFSAMGIPLVAGRFFNDADDPSAHTVIVNQSFARKYFPHRDPVGGHISTDQNHVQWNTVVGVVGDIRDSGLEEAPVPQNYFPFGHHDSPAAYIAVRSQLAPSAVIAAVREAVRSVDPSLAVADIHTMSDLVSDASARRRFQTFLLTGFAVLALLMALVGLYGLMAYSVNRRTREVGIRMALGAQRGDVLLLVLKNAAALLGCGLAAGLACAWIATQAIRSFLFGVGAHDPLTVVVVCALLVLCGLSAALIPARRAASIHPTEALRAE